jgi:hypothetical protein
LDERIPFEPKRVSVYLDFVSLWIRALGFILRRYGDRAIEPAAALIDSMGELYRYAAQVYRQNLSTTRRPRYLKNPRFIIIHLTDPHLLCVPSLHVMVVVRAYTQFRQILRTFNEEDLLKPQIEELYRGALEITEAVLYVKQHSVNCVPAALYSMTRFQEEFFPPQEARSFTQNLFRSPHDLAPGDDGRIREYISQLYGQFTEEGKTSEDWRFPILKFLDPLRRRE